MLPTEPNQVYNNMVKEKLKSIRTYDEDGFRKRAACLCFRDDTERELLLVTSSRFKDKWIVPGGGVEPEEDPCLAASREVFEEAGARGVIGRLLGVFENEDKKTRTSVFTFIVEELTDEWDDARMLGRKRDWFTMVEAKEKLSHKPIQVTYLELLRDSSLV
ncbi:hypothetical protein SNE40_012122 [Patella caerulea]|uniref:diphosphoinositol-polyphosphate diphosphatase n=1 Tax=Patella caerulea TaxID=87958 RepID=A0AAN8PZC0_PATCE